MQKIETESGQESLGHSSIYLLLYLCDMKVKNIGSDIHSVSLAQGGASKCCRIFSLFITIFVIRSYSAYSYYRNSKSEGFSHRDEFQS